jgi:hypothetical protein
MKEVREAHNYFAPDYDTIADYFDCGNIDDTAALLFDFCKANVKYKIESQHHQTTKSPAAILSTGEGDCKHYAGFIGGVLDAIERQTGNPLNWYYRFASYDMFDSTPQHVFVVVKDEDGELWIDPVLSELDQRLEPQWQPTDKKPPRMALHRISGYQDNTIGWSTSTSTGYTSSGPAIVPVQQGDYLGLSRYGLATNTNIATLTGQLQALINKGPKPYTLSPQLVDKIIYDNVQQWNFFYPSGATPYPLDWAALNLPISFVKVGNRWTYDRDEEPPHNAPWIHHLASWAQWLVSNYSASPYIVTIDHLKRLGKSYKTPSDGNILTHKSAGDAWFTNVVQTAGETLADVKKIVLKVAAAVPRNAFLALVGLNVFGLASKIWKKIEAGKWDEIARKWESIGGRAEALYNTAKSGSSKPKVLSGFDQHMRGATIGEPISITAAIASAAPIIAMMLKMLDKDGDTTAALSQVKGALEAAYPELAVKLDGFDFLDAQSNKPIEFEFADNMPSTQDGTYTITNGSTTSGGDDAMDMIKKNLPLIGIGAAAVYFMTKKKSTRKVSGPGKSNLLPILLIGGAAVYFMNKKKADAQAIPTAIKVDEPDQSQTLPYIEDEAIVDVNDAPLSMHLTDDDIRRVIFGSKAYSLNPALYLTMNPETLRGVYDLAVKYHTTDLESASKLTRAILLTAQNEYRVDLIRPLMD